MGEFNGISKGKLFKIMRQELPWVKDEYIRRALAYGFIRGYKRALRENSQAVVLKRQSRITIRYAEFKVKQRCRKSPSPF